MATKIYDTDVKQMNCIFTCYDNKQKKFFESNNIRDILYGLHPKTIKPFWVYERDEKFNIAFKEWLSQRD